MKKKQKTFSDGLKIGLQLKKTTQLAAAFNIFSAMLLFMVVGYEFSRGSWDWAMIVIVLISTIDVLIGVQAIISYDKEREQNRNYLQSISDLESLNKSMRVQRHDFKNHMQVVFGLLEMDEYDEAKKYLTSAFDDFHDLTRALRTASPAVNALLSAKKARSEKLGIEFKMDVTTDLSEVPLSSVEQTVIIGNIVDNAIEAIALHNPMMRLINVNISERADAFQFSIENTGDKIPLSEIGKVFRQGFSSKGESRGTGLTTTMEIVKSHNGTIDVFSNNAKTRFVVRLPKANKASKKNDYKI